MRAKRWTRRNRREDVIERKETIEPDFVIEPEDAAAKERELMLKEIIQIRTKAVRSITTIKTTPPDVTLKPHHLEDIYTDIHNLAVILERLLHSEKWLMVEEATDRS